MPIFEIPDGPTTVDLKRSGDAKNPGPATGSIVFNVTNKSTDSCAGRLSVVPSGSSKEEWFAIDGDRERTFAAGETQTATIKVTTPKDVAAGDYPFRLRAVAVNDPDNEHTEGPVATAKVPAAAAPGGSHWWIWLIIALVVLIALGVGGYFLVKSLKDGGGEEPTNNVVTAENTVPKFVDQNVDSIAANAGGYQIIKNETANAGHPPRVVFDQDPKPGTKLAPGQRVILSYEPGVRVPDLPGNLTFVSAPTVLRNAHLEPGDYFCDRGSGPNAEVGRITAFSPGSGTQVASGSKVNMIALQAAPCPFIVLIQPQFLLQMPQAKTMTMSQRRMVMEVAATHR